MAQQIDLFWSQYFESYNGVPFECFCDANGNPIPAPNGRMELLETFINQLAQAGAAVGGGTVFYVLSFQTRAALPPSAQHVYLGNPQQALLPILAAFDPNCREMQPNSESVFATAQSMHGYLGYQHFESQADPVTGYVFPEGYYLCRFLLQPG